MRRDGAAAAAGDDDDAAAAGMRDTHDGVAVGDADGGDAERRLLRVALDVHVRVQKWAASGCGMKGHQEMGESC